MATQTYHSIQYLRGFAAIIVVVFHMFSSPLFPLSAYTSWMRGGVDIFFIISGFIMVKSTEGRDISPLLFLQKRIIRIVPLYWIMTIIMVSSLGFTGWHTIASFLFIPATYTGRDYMMPLVEPGWTLNYEMFFYVIFGLALGLRHKIQVPIVTGILVTLVVIGMVLPLTGVPGYYTASLILEFALGMWLAKSSVRFPIWNVPLGICLMAMLYIDESTRLLTLGLPALFIVGGMLSAEKRLPISRYGLLIGDASYAIYLVHLMTLGTLAQIWKTMLPMGPRFIPAGIAVTVLVGIFTHLYLEQPLTRILNDHVKTKDARKHLAESTKTA